MKQLVFARKNLTTNRFEPVFVLNEGTLLYKGVMDSLGPEGLVTLNKARSNFQKMTNRLIEDTYNTLNLISKQYGIDVLLSTDVEKQKMADKKCKMVEQSIKGFKATINTPQQSNYEAWYIGQENRKEISK